MAHRMIRAAFVLCTVAALSLIPARAVDYHGWFFSNSGDKQPAPLSDCVKRAPAALASQGFTANQNGENPVYFDAASANGTVNVILWCIGEARGYDMTLVVMSEDSTRSSFELGRNIYSAFTGKPPPAESTTDISGVWRLASTCNSMVAGGWSSVLQLNQAANGTISGTTRADPLSSTIVVGLSKFSSGTLNLTLAPDGWSQPLQLTGTLNGIQIAGKVHHLGPDDCTFTMTRS